jgi:hypothetical protein
MVDYSIATQIRPVQMPNVGEMYGQIQNIQLNRMRMAEAQETAQERNALRELAATGTDLYSPEGLARLRQVAPTLAPRLEQAGVAMMRERRAAEKDASEIAANRIRIQRDLLPSVTNADQYREWRAATVAALPGLANQIPAEYSPDAVRRLMLSADRALQQHYVSQEGGGQRRVIGIDPVSQQATVVPGSEMASPERLQVVPLTGGGVGFASPSQGTFSVGREVPFGAAPPTVPQPTAPAAGAPAAGARVPTSQSTDLLAIDSAIRRAEGTGRNPRSSAQGQYQFTDGTFVQEFRRAFPDAAQGRSDQDILRFRNAPLQDGRRIEDVLGPAFTQRNAQTLQQAGFEPVGGNVYLAHHFGANGAVNLLRADPSTPMERLVSPQVIEANPFLRGATAGQITQWASNAVDYGPGEARRLLDASRTGAPNALALAGPRNAMAAAPAPRATPTTLADLQARQLELEMAKLRGQNVVRREEQPARVEEAGQIAGAQAQAQADVRGAEEERKRQRGRESIESVLRDMATTYGRLDELGGIPSERRSGLANVPAYLAGTAPGQEVGKALGTQTQTQRNQIQASVRQLLTAIKNATGMSAQEMNSNVELQQLLAAVSSPTQSIESVRGILSSISRQYGLGQLTFPEPTAPPAAAPREQVPGPRRGAAAPAASPAGAAPTLEQFLAAARRANPGATDQQLTDFWNRTYGGR